MNNTNDPQKKYRLGTVSKLDTYIGDHWRYIGNHSCAHCKMILLLISSGSTTFSSRRHFITDSTSIGVMARDEIMLMMYDLILESVLIGGLVPDAYL